MSEIGAKLLFLLVPAFFVYSLVANLRKWRRGDDLSVLPRIEAEFRALVVDVEAPELCFDGRTAHVVDERREGMHDGNSGTFTLHRVRRFARNAHGEYFFFISEGSGTPFFKHVTQANAKIELGKKYIAPARC